MFEKQTPTGLEMMLRSMGLASVLDAAKRLAESGAVLKIITFADNLEKRGDEHLGERLARIEAALGLEPYRPAGAAEQRRLAGQPGSDAEPGAGPGDRRDVA